MADKNSVSAFSFHSSIIGQFKKRLFLVFLLLMLNTVLASLSIGIVLPVFQTLLDPLHESVQFLDILPFINAYEPGFRLVILSLVTILLFLGKAVISMFTAFASNDFIHRLRFHWIDRIGENYLQAPLLNITGRKQGDLLNDWFNETLAASRFYKASLNYLSSVTLVIALLGLGLLVNWQAMISMLAVGSIAAVLVRLITYKRSESLSKKKLRVNQALNSAMVEDLANVRDLKLMSAEKARLQHLSGLGTELKSIFVRGAVLGEVPRVSGEFLAVLFLMGFVLVSIVVLGMSPVNILPMMAFFFIAFYRLVGATSTAMSSRVKALNDLYSVKRIQDLLEQGKHKEILNVGLPLAKIDTDIHFKNVLFKYDAENKALKTINVLIPKGKLTLLVGPSGSGKSTMLDLMMRLIDPVSGEIQINDKSAPDYRLADWRNCFGYVSQDALLFNSSIRENMLLANPWASEKDIQQALMLAGATDFIKGLPNDYDTPVGDRGYSLSGGQRKRIAIARALIRKPSVLILDEATTSFEQQLEQKLLIGLRDALPYLTIIQVTHRVKITEIVDWVVIVEDGNVVACGSTKDVALSDYGYK